MAITVFQTIEGPTLQDGLNPSGTRTFKAFGTTDEDAARTAVLLVAPATLDSMPIQNTSLSPLGDDSWAVDVNYGPIDPAVFTFAFDTTGKTAHTTVSRVTLTKLKKDGAPALPPAPDFLGAIGVTNDDIKGVDVIVPSYSWTETHRKPISEVDDTYKMVLRDMTGQKNDDAFRGFFAGEVLFMGARGSIRTGEDFEIAFSFASEREWTLEVIGPFIVTKKGWDYFWVRYADVEDAAAKHLTQQPIAAYVEEVYEDADFADLEIGTT